MDSHDEAANSRPCDDSHEQDIAGRASDPVELPKALSKILATADPYPMNGEKVIVFEYLPRQSKCRSCIYVVDESGRNLQTSNFNIFRLAWSSILLLVSSALYQLGIMVTGWGHVQLVLLEGCAESDFRGKIFGMTNNEHNSVILHSNNGKDWKPVDKARYAFGGCTVASEGDVQRTADQILSRWKNKGQMYGILYYNCEVFSLDLAALIGSHESHRKFFRYGRRSGFGEEEERKIRQSLVNESPGSFFYECQSQRSYRRVLAWVGRIWIAFMIHQFFLLTPPGLSVIERLNWLRRPGPSPFMRQFIFSGLFLTYSNILASYVGGRQVFILWITGLLGIIFVPTWLIFF